MKKIFMALVVALAMTQVSAEAATMKQMIKKTAHTVEHVVLWVPSFIVATLGVGQFYFVNQLDMKLGAEDTNNLSMEQVSVDENSLEPMIAGDDFIIN